MKITKYGSATVLLETDDVKVLCDPWLTDGIYYGSWCNYPPINLEECDFSGIDYVYVSHVHPDHFDPKTMELINKDVPVLIHAYHQKFLKFNIERLGFNVIELENGVPLKISPTTNFSIFAADDCNPEICGKIFGCVNDDVKGSMQLDSICVMANDNYTLVNTNDCPYPIAAKTLERIKTIFPVIDFALIGYTSASLFPHCMIDYTKAQYQKGKEKARLSGLATGLNTLKTIKPRYYMPFAGTYIIGGREYKKNENLPMVEVQEAVSYFNEVEPDLEKHSQSVLLNFGATFDLKSENQTAKYVPIDPLERKSYIENIASNFPYTFDSDDIPSEAELFELFKNAAPRLKKKQDELFFYEDINLIFDIDEDKYVCINMMDADPKIIEDIDDLKSYHRFKLDKRLLKRVLMGPRFANWNNLEIGAMLDFARKPDEYRMDVHTIINSLHV